MAEKIIKPVKKKEPEINWFNYFWFLVTFVDARMEADGDSSFKQIFSGVGIVLAVILTLTLVFTSTLAGLIIFVKITFALILLYVAALLIFYKIAISKSPKHYYYVDNLSAEKKLIIISTIKNNIVEFYKNVKDAYDAYLKRVEDEKS